MHRDRRRRDRPLRVHQLLESSASPAAILTAAVRASTGADDRKIRNWADDTAPPALNEDFRCLREAEIANIPLSCRA